MSSTAGQIVVPPSTALAKRPPTAYLVVEQDGTVTPLRVNGHHRRPSLGEVAGGTTADLAAVVCCCPCVLVNMVVLAVYKVPKGVARKALGSKRRRRLLKKGGRSERQQSSSDGDDDSELQIVQVSSSSSAVSSGLSLDSDKDVVELEKEMWEKFYGAGFWRSYSQRSDERSEITELSR
ncbi:PREDICTED: uncharacterized protein LOC109153292 [Ipomoea nil]|uniref:uncharacterized protein LOC109153292 n=1 Tax=Ipomoea nil TaxID=35883 RepID=UPI000900EA62|nr:PREDICTED: uncharacterized protein LOC109153292 [Ipomoea nil]